MNKDKYENEKEIHIDWKEINRTIKILTKNNVVIFDPYKRSYFIDGFEISEKFINDVLSKSSHLINSIANMTLNSKLGSIDAYKNNKKELVEIKDENVKIIEEKREDVKPMYDENGEKIKYLK